MPTIYKPSNSSWTYPTWKCKLSLARRVQVAKSNSRPSVSPGLSVHVGRPIMMLKGLILDRTAVPADHQVNPVNSGSCNHCDEYKPCPGLLTSVPQVWYYSTSFVKTCNYNERGRRTLKRVFRHSMSGFPLENFVSVNIRISGSSASRYFLRS